MNLAIRKWKRLRSHLCRADGSVRVFEERESDECHADQMQEGYGDCNKPNISRAWREKYSPRQDGAVLEKAFKFGLGFLAGRFRACGEPSRFSEADFYDKGLPHSMITDIDESSDRTYNLALLDSYVFIFTWSLRTVFHKWMWIAALYYADFAQ